MKPNLPKRSVLASALAVVAVSASSQAMALTRCEVLEDAQSWVDHGVMYCQGPNGYYCTSGCNPCYYDPLRGGECWRPDCSGYVSATWWLSYAMNTSGLCNWAQHIGWDDLQPGDAVVACSQHAILFASWADASHSVFHAYETGVCGTPAHHSTRNRWNMGEYTPLRRWGIQECCSAGQVETQGCGNCGKQTRVCSSDGHWGGWSGCDGQGPCSPGQQDSKACCDCGTQTRTCGGNCQWQDWGGCGGPDPNGGNTDCDTGEPGPCASGRERCVQGCVKCVRTYEPTAESCDDVDNDCSGTVDDGHPLKMGDPPPKYAAELSDQSYPLNLAPDGAGIAWASFVNRGTSAWKRGEVWLTTQSALQGELSPFYDEETWDAWNVAAVLTNNVLPGETANFQWRVHMPGDATGTVGDTFVLSVPPDSPLRCPVPDVVMSVRAGGPEHLEGLAEEPPVAGSSGGCSVGDANTSPRAAAWLSVVALAIGAALRRRRQ
ncbi:MAG TPA: MYXO-CTERM sorting domain-containing protein [Polyangiaceae bacterium]|nr:MYXO-CTERM sorting domain-containing protein [Polyangiaceae bacterium]